MGERRQHRNVHSLDAVAGVGDGARQSDTLLHRGVHLPVARHQRKARRSHAHDRAASRSRSAATPGSVLPSRNSMVAPPPVLMWPILSATPAASIAAARSPPPITVYARDRDRAPATARVPAANASIS